jgi:hypothetical protein
MIDKQKKVLTDTLGGLSQVSGGLYRQRGMNSAFCVVLVTRQAKMAMIESCNQHIVHKKDSYDTHFCAQTNDSLSSFALDWPVFYLDMSLSPKMFQLTKVSIENS